MTWGFYQVDLSTKVAGIRDKGTNHVSSRVINEAMKPLVTIDYSGTSINDSYSNGNSSAFCCCWRYSTPGTSEGEWYLPSYYDMTKYQQNYAAINAAITNVKNVVGTSYLNSVYSYQWTSTEYSNSDVYGLTVNGSFYQRGKYATDHSVRPVFITHINEL